MKFTLWYASNPTGRPEKKQMRIVDLETLEDVLKLIQDEGQDIIFQHSSDDEHSIIVYDDYLE